MKPYTEATTRERLEAAARVMGIEIEQCTCKQDAWPFRTKHGKRHFNPMSDDAENRRLQVAMGADLGKRSCGRWVASVHEINSHRHNNPNDAIMELAWLVDQASGSN